LASVDFTFYVNLYSNVLGPILSARPCIGDEIDYQSLFLQESSPENFLLFAMMANAARIAKNESRAIEFFHIAEKMSVGYINVPEYTTPYAFTVMAYFARGSGDLDKAIKYQEIAREIIDAFQKAAEAAGVADKCFYLDGVQRYVALKEKRREI